MLPNLGKPAQNYRLNFLIVNPKTEFTVTRQFIKTNSVNKFKKMLSSFNQN